MANNKRIPWTIEHAAAEFGINPRTLSARLKQANLFADKDGHYSTKQIAQAVFGDLEFERIRKTRAEADEIERSNRIASGELARKANICADLRELSSIIAKVILGSSLPDQEKHDIQEALWRTIQKFAENVGDRSPQTPESDPSKMSGSGQTATSE